jgi:lipopolysaccharide exporter
MRLSLRRKRATVTHRRSTLDGLAVTHAATILTFIAQVPYTAVVSRLLTPQEFGIVALAGVLLRFSSYFASAGIVTAVIQRTHLSVGELRGAFTISLITSATLCALIVAVAPLMATAFGNADIAAVARVLSITIVLTAVGSTSVGLLRRDARFRTLASIDLLSYVLGYPVTGITLAALGFGVWSLVFAALVQAAVASLSGILLARPPLRPTRSLALMLPLAKFGGGVSVAGFLEFLSSNTDTIAVGRYAGTAAIGQYNRSSLLFGLPMYHFTNNTVKVLFPRFAQEKDNPKALAGLYQRAMVVILGLFAPLCVVVFFVSDSLVRIILGSGWSLAASLAPLVTAAMAADLACHIPGAVYEATGRLGVRILLQLVHLLTILSLVAFVIRRHGPIREFAVAWLIGQTVRHVALLIFLPPILGQSARNLLRPYFEAAALAAAMLLGSSAGHFLGGEGWWGGLVLPVVMGGGSTIVAIRTIPGLLFRQELLRLPLGARVGRVMGRR